MSLLYVLKLESNKFYIGKTNNIKKRFTEHFNGINCSYTTIYKPLQVLETHKYYDFGEDMLTLKYMKRYGINNVRGGSYSSPNLPEEEIRLINKMIKTSNDRCYICNDKGHYANACKRK